jgi:hypothetical protein
MSSNQLLQSRLSLSTEIQGSPLAGADKLTDRFSTSIPGSTLSSASSLSLAETGPNITASTSNNVTAALGSNAIDVERSIGNLNGTRVFSGWVGTTDKSDIYSFSLNQSRTVNMTLSGLGADADMQLIRDFNGNGLIDSKDVIYGSTQGSANAEWINTTLTSGNYFVKVSHYSGGTNYNFTVSTGDWYSSNLGDAGLIGQARTFGQDGQINRNEMISILRETQDYGKIDATELRDLRKILAGLGYMMPDSVKVLGNKIINSDPANTRSNIGNLFAGSDSIQMTRLIDKWFMGGDRPTSQGSYRFAGGSLFQNGISLTDIRQGGTGDCYFMAALGGYANNRPTAIQDMFTDNRDGTFTVRFFNNGAADYVTVDRWLPTDINGNAIHAGWNGGSVSESNNELWVALVEKAYAQLNQSGWLGRDNSNSYAGLDGGWSAPVMEQITGKAAFSIPVDSLLQHHLINLLHSSTSITAGFVSGGGFGVVDKHEYTITSYDSATQTFHLRNPWGSTHADVTWSQLRTLNAQIEWQ